MYLSFSRLLHEVAIAFIARRVPLLPTEARAHEHQLEGAALCRSFSVHSDMYTGFYNIASISLYFNIHANGDNDIKNFDKNWKNDKRLCLFHV